MSNPNNSPEQKAAWQANKKLGSRFIRVIDSTIYKQWAEDPLSRKVFDSQGRRTK